MNRSKSILRIVSLLTLGCIGALLLFGEEQDQNLLAFTVRFIFDKALGLLLCALTVRLYNRWRRTDPLLMAYDKMCDDTDTEVDPSGL